MRSLLVGLMLVSLVLAGCTSDKEKDGDGATATSTTSSSASTTTSSTGTTTSRTSTSTAPEQQDDAPNTAPIGSISALINGTSVQFNLTGSDEDGDELSWTLSFGDNSTAANGTDLPTVVNHVYGAPGDFVATFAVSDGTNTTAYDLNLTVTNSTGAGLVLVQAQGFPSNPVNSQEAEGAFAGAQTCVGWVVGENGQDCVWFELKAEYTGKAFTLTTDVGDPDYEIWPGCSYVALFMSDAGPFAVDGSVADGPHSGTIAGAGCLVAWVKEPGMDLPTHTLTIV